MNDTDLADPRIYVSHIFLLAIIFHFTILLSEFANRRIVGNGIDTLRNQAEKIHVIAVLAIGYIYTSMYPAILFALGYILFCFSIWITK